MEDKMSDCIKSCMKCSTVCNKTAMMCLEKGGEHAEASHLRLMLDCAELCKMAASFMARNSDFAAKLCELCAELCERCAESCESLGDDEDMKRCAEMCRKCAEECRTMAP